MSEFKTEITVDIHDVDFNGIAKTSALMRYIQSAAQTQLTVNGMSYEELKAMNKAFILSRVTIEFTKAVRAYEKITATTFPCNSRGYTFLRCYKLVKDGETIGRAIAAWALIDTEKRSLVRVNDFELGLNTLAPLDIPSVRISVPDSIRAVGSYDVTYADTDQNNHMNNTKYPDIYANFLPLEGKRISDISISYINEAPTKDRLSVMMTEEDGIYYFRTIRSDGKINSEAMIKLCDI